jgi:hypothetical protein
VAGTYYLVITSPGLGAQSWEFTNSPTVTTDTGVIFRAPEMADNLQGDGNPDNAYPPGSSFVAEPFDLLLGVSGTPVARAQLATPEPSSLMMLMVLGVCGITAKLLHRFSRRSKSKSKFEAC